MARLSPEKSLAHLSLDVAVSPGKKNGIDPSLIGVFDETLRQARRSEGGAAADLPEPAKETRPPEKTGAPNARTERDDRESDDTVSGDADAAAVSDRETRSNDEVESDESAAEPEATSAESAEQTKAEEDADEADDAADEMTDEAAAVATTTSQTAVQEPVDEAIEPTASECEETEPVSSDEDAPKNPEKPAVVEKTDSPSTATAVDQSADEPVGDETIAAATTDWIDPTQEDSGDEAESESEPSTSGREKTQGTTPLGKREDETGKLPEKPNNAGDSAANSREDASEQQSDRGSQRRGQSTRGERHEVAAQPGNAQVTPADADRGAQPAANPTAAAPPGTSIAVDPAGVIPELAATSDLGAAGHASQTTGSADVVTPPESRASAAQSQTAAGQSAGKGAGEAVDAAKFVQRVANAFAALGQRSGPVRLKLYPPELGSLRMEITVKNGAMSARVEAETTAAKSVLLDNLPILRERLAEQGIKVDRFDVDISDRPQGGPSEGPNDDGRSFQRGNRDTGSRADARGPEITSTERRDEQMLGIDGRLDVFI